MMLRSDVLVIQNNQIPHFSTSTYNLYQNVRLVSFAVLMRRILRIFTAKLQKAYGEVHLRIQQLA